jgi:hypothetical protein
VAGIDLPRLAHYKFPNHLMDVGVVRLPLD